ncbi:16S rRNA (guanine(527)-N(7))-methyltransferase RsmG [Candidatus Enterovibrio escicola]|uniref:16S rRNA (guanine(527)-N(7))-methyltransferase RsmG n=1 Tax=Candidatus Enterovibrio escicola TaxID=1927127 RepID=UPI001237DE58|nr:16S rRNA (guanine(527)-N(7))-methyltransferase RsmG [Candidatus Enterovibrio escacola]
MKKRLTELIKQGRMDISSYQEYQLIRYVELLHKWNSTYNLTSVRDPHDMVIKHIMDSLVVSPYLKGKTFIDVGTGPGLPGIPLAIINPTKSLTLLDCLGKRINFIRQVIYELKINNITTVKSRVEEFQPEEGFDGVLSRGFASMKNMVKICHHLPSQNGRFLALKGRIDQKEIDDLPAECSVTDIKPLSVPGLEGERHLVILVK